MASSRNIDAVGAARALGAPFSNGKGAAHAAICQLTARANCVVFALS
jgi:hypothetical protein